MKADGGERRKLRCWSTALIVNVVAHWCIEGKGVVMLLG